MDAAVINGLGWILLGIVLLLLIWTPALRGPSGKYHPEAANCFALMAILLVVQSVLFLILGLEVDDDVTKPVLVFLWSAGICLACAVWLNRGEEDGGGGTDGWQEQHPQPRGPGGLECPYLPALNWQYWTVRNKQFNSHKA